MNVLGGAGGGAVYEKTAFSKINEKVLRPKK